MKLRQNLDDDGKPVSFATLMELESINEFVFRSTTAAFAPAAPFTADPIGKHRAFGGHVYAQSVLAASRTVAAGFTVNNVSGFFILMGRADLPFVYRVKIVRNGKTYCTRTVEVTQEESKGMCFSCTCTFKRREPSPVEVQEWRDLVEEYKVVLGNGNPRNHADATNSDTAWFPVVAAKTKANPFPGVVSKKVEMEAYNCGKTPLQRRQLVYYSAIGELPPVSADPNLHAAVHLYASDRNSLWFVSRLLGLQNYSRATASLCHTVIFHLDAEHLAMTGGNGDAKWCLSEIWTDRASDGRVMHHSKMLDRNGRHLASTMQDGMLKMHFDDEKQKEEYRKTLDEGGKSRL